MNIFLLNLLIPFIIKQVVKFGHEINWTQVKVDAQIRIKKIIPGEFFDEYAVNFIIEILDKIEAIFDEEKITKIVELIKAKDLEKCMHFILELLT